MASQTSEKGNVSEIKHTVAVSFEDSPLANQTNEKESVIVVKRHTEAASSQDTPIPKQNEIDQAGEKGNMSAVKHTNDASSEDTSSLK